MVMDIPESLQDLLYLWPELSTTDMHEAFMKYKITFGQNIIYILYH